MLKKNIRLALILLFSGYLLYAQDVANKSTTEQIWLDYNPSIKINERLHLYGDIGFRTIFPHEWNRAIIRPSISYKLPKALLKKLQHNSELHGGIGFFFTNNKSESNRLEIRPFQGYKLIWPNRPRIQIKHYVRLEERFDIQTNNWKNTFGLRFRYQARMELHFSGDYTAFYKRIYIPAEIELFWNLIGTKQFNDAVRISSGIGYEFSSAWKWELNIGYHYTRNTVEDVFATNDVVFRIRTYHKF
jgi:hypothetical protein